MLGFEHTPRAEEATISETSVTIKYGKEFDKTWTTFKGTVSDVRGQIEAYFGLTPDPDLTLNDLVINVTQQAQGVNAAVSGLKGRVISSQPEPPVSTIVDMPLPGDEAQSGTDPWKQAAEEPAEENLPHPIFAQIAAETTVDGLKRLWAENQPAFRNAVVMQAWKARGQALTAAAQ